MNGTGRDDVAVGRYQISGDHGFSNRDEGQSNFQ